MTDYNNDFDYDERPPAGKVVRGYQIVIVALALILGVMAYIFYRQSANQKADFDAERLELNEQFAGLRGEFDNLQTTNDTLNAKMAVERNRADSILTKLNSERRLSASKIREYETMLKNMRASVHLYMTQVDSLNKLNLVLIGENREMREQVTVERLRADKAEESVGELSTKVRQGSVVRVRDLSLVPISANDRELSRAGRAAQLRANFILSANELAEPGERVVYMRIIGPDGYLLSTGGGSFDFEGEVRPFTASRQIDYQNADLAVSIYYKGAGIAAGTYKLEVYMDGYLLGSREVSLR